MQISPVGLLLIRALEGLRETPSPDITGRMAIGYGHTYGVTAETPAISPERAAQLLEQDISTSFGPAIDELAVPMTQNEFDATCSLVYQVGAPVLATTSPFGAALRAGSWRQAGDAMLSYNRVDGREIPELTSRRTVERAVFLASPPAASAAATAHSTNERSDATTNGTDERSDAPALRSDAPALRSDAPALGADDRSGAPAPDEPIDQELASAATEAVRDALVLERRTVWLAAVKGLRPDGTAVAPGWDVDGRAALYGVLCRLTDFQARS